MTMTELEKQRAERIAQQEKELKELEASIPKPTGYHVLIALPEIDETFDGTNIAKAGQTKREELVLASIGVVLDMGDQAYRDPDRYPTGPWCQAGDYVMFRPNSGTRFRIGNNEYRLMNDDSIQAVVPNPRAISRA
jgi:co-chaperonin GroES (HSP10)